MIQSVAQPVKQRLLQKLPGAEAHQKMAPLVAGRLAAQPNAHTRTGGVLLFLYPDPYTGQIHLPLIVRSMYEGVHSGQIAFPGGKKENSDSSLIVTALREAEEEIGIDRENVEILGQLSTIYIPASNFLVYPTVVYSAEKPIFKPDPREVAKVLEANIALLEDKSKQGLKAIKVANNLTIQSPFYDIEGYTVWGATAMILSEFITIWQEAVK